jgi:hypothetical protein
LPIWSARDRSDRPKLAAQVLDHGKTVSQAASDAGVSVQIVKTAVEREKGRREAEPAITPDMLSMTQQQKNAAWRRQELHRMEIAFRQRVENEVIRRIDEIILPHWKEKIEQAQELFNRRKALMDKATFNKIRRCLHPDSRRSLSDPMLAEALDAFMALEKYLLNEKDSPTMFGDLPGSLAEWDKMKTRKPAKRSVKSGLERRA